MTEEIGRPQTRFDRRKIELPQAVDGYDYVTSTPAPRRGSRWPLGMMSLLALGLTGLLAYGYLAYQAQSETILLLQQQFREQASDEARELVDARTQIASLQAEIASRPGNDVATGDRLDDDRDAASAALALARQRIAALQAELGVPATGRHELSDLTTFESGIDNGQRLDALLLEIRLLTRERDAARDQIDQMLENAIGPRSAVDEPKVDNTALATENDDLRAQVAVLVQELSEQRVLAEQANAELAIALSKTDGSAVVERELQSRIKELEAQAQSFLDKSEQDQAILRAENDNLKSETGELRLELENRLNQAEASNEALAVLQAELAALRIAEDELAQAKAANQSLNQGMTQLQERVSVLATERDEIRTELESLKLAELDKAGLTQRFESELQSAAEQLAGMKIELADMEQERDLAIEASAQIQSDAAAADVSTELDEAQARLADLTAELAAARSRIVALEAIAQANREQDRASTQSAAVAGSVEVDAELQALKERQKILETVLARFTPQPPEPAPR